jgi:hypothetical protein
MRKLITRQKKDQSVERHRDRERERERERERKEGGWRRRRQ